MAVLCGMQIAQELVDCIVNRLPEDKEELSNCSLISHSFNFSSQRRLFHSLSLRISDFHPSKTPLNIQKFQDISTILSHRGIFLHVQSLFLTVGKCGPSTPALIHIVDQLVNLKRVTIECARVIASTWLDNDIIRSCCHPTVTYFDVSYAKNVAWYHLQHCPSLQHLSLRYSTLDDYAPPDYASIPPTRVSSFLFVVPPGETDGFCQWMQNAQCPIDVRSLSAFALVNPYSLNRIAPILPIVPKTLESLAIQPFGRSSSDQQFWSLLPSLIIDLSTFSRLSCLTLSVYDSDTDSHATSWVFAELSTIPSTNTLAELHLIIATGNVDMSLLELQELWQHWQCLDNVLMDRKFDKLESIAIHVQVPAHYEKNNAEGVVPMFKQFLPRTAEHKPLDIDVSLPWMPFITMDDEEFPKLGQKYRPTLNWRC